MTLDKVPAVAFNTIVAPPVVRLLPEASFNWIIIVGAVIPSATNDVWDALMVELDTLGVPLVTNVTVSLSVIDTPPTVPVMVDVPVVVPDVSVAV